MNQSTYLRTLKSLVKVWEELDVDNEDIVTQVDLLGEQLIGVEEDEIDEGEFVPEEDGKVVTHYSTPAIIPKWTTREKEGWR